MSDAVRPALRPDEWASFKNVHRQDGDYDLFLTLDPGWFIDIGDADYTIRVSEPHNRRAIAALCLDGLPEGFTLDDVRAINYVLEHASFWDRGPEGQGWPSDEMNASTARLATLAPRIAALLRPERA